MPKPQVPSCVLCGTDKAEAIAGAEDYFHCPICDLRYLNPEQRLRPEEEKSRYDLHRNDENDVRYLNYLEPLFAALNQRLMPAATGLDYGCGPAPALAGLFRRAGHQVDLYDPFYAPNEELLDKQYDFISTSEAAEHFYDPHKEFSRLFSLLKPGGWLGVMTQMTSDTLDFASWFYRRDPTHVVFYSPRSMKWIANRLGFCEMLHPSARVVLLRRPANSVLKGRQS